MRLTNIMLTISTYANSQTPANTEMASFDGGGEKPRHIAKNANPNISPHKVIMSGYQANQETWICIMARRTSEKLHFALSAASMVSSIAI